MNQFQSKLLVSLVLLMGNEEMVTQLVLIVYSLFNIQDGDTFFHLFKVIFHQCISTVSCEFQEEDVRLIGTLIPRYSRFLPRPPRSKNQEYYFSYQCFRLVCERLFGRAACFSVYSTEIPAREYKDPHLELVVTKVNNNNLYMYLQTGVRYSIVSLMGVL